MANIPKYNPRLPDPLLFVVVFGSDREKGQPVLPEHVHPGRRHEGGVPRDDDGGDRLAAAQGPGGHGEAAALPPQVTAR